MHPMMAAVNKKIKKAAAFERAIGKAAMSSDGASTVSTVLWESRADVDDRAGSDDDGKVEAAGGAAATVGSMQVEEEAIEATDLRGAAGCGALPTDGGVWSAEAEGDGDVWCMCGCNHSGGSCWYGRNREFSG